MKPITLEWIQKAEADYWTMERESRARKNPNFDGVCFHAQQCVEKYMKAMLHEMQVSFPRTHDLSTLLDLLIGRIPAWEMHREDLASLFEFAVSFRYPGDSADRVIALDARNRCRRIRNAAKLALNL